MIKPDSLLSGLIREHVEDATCPHPETGNMSCAQTAAASQRRRRSAPVRLIHALVAWLRLQRRLHKTRRLLDRLDARALQDIGLCRHADRYDMLHARPDRDPRLLRALGQAYGAWPRDGR
ncbi:hypothetical protein GCM10007285_32840 [Stappia taiwanensis]|nr:DUF1127 domain-containing protein [Stappia taiwanensis]GGF02581.1 hypothetical protein GCM10007285_32840 [Stappia taiwanensis]